MTRLRLRKHSKFSNILYLVRRLVEVDEYSDGDLAQEDYDEEDEELKHD